MSDRERIFASSRLVDALGGCKEKFNIKLRGYILQFILRDVSAAFFSNPPPRLVVGVINPVEFFAHTGKYVLSSG